MLQKFVISIIIFLIMAQSVQGQGARDFQGIKSTEDMSKFREQQKLFLDRLYQQQKGAAALAKKQIVSPENVAKSSSTISNKLLQNVDTYQLASGKRLNDTWSIVRPDITTTVNLSNTDQNRFYCPSSDIAYITTSSEKGIEKVAQGKDAYIKFKMSVKGNQITYATTPSEFFIKCGDRIYNLIALPKRIPSQTIEFKNDINKNAEKNIEMFQGMSHELRAQQLFKQIYHADDRDNLPSSFNVIEGNFIFDGFHEINLYLRRDIYIEGLNLMVREFIITLKNKGKSNNAYDYQVEFQETDFLIEELMTADPLAILVDPHGIIKKGDFSRLLIIQRTN